MGDWPEEHDYIGFSHCVRCARKVKEELDASLSAAEQRATDAEALLRELEPAFHSHARDYAHACHSTVLHPCDAALLGRISAFLARKGAADGK